MSVHGYDAANLNQPQFVIYKRYINKTQQKNIYVSLLHIWNIHQIQMSNIIQEIYRQNPTEKCLCLSVTYLKYPSNTNVQYYTRDI